ncbi:MAG: MarR family transcriptional regulator [Ruminococcaceae bacterium]|nr:MarR family transcriptional regulator [Oscillospiraceae bacterium]MBD5117442.1 MarR family transcriptional regulator [Oscillospiraceae bacterium]
MDKKIISFSKRWNYLIAETNAAYHDASVKLGISDSASIILYTICNSGGSCLLSEICLLSGIKKQTLNSAIRKLEENGIVYLEAVDGKKKSVCLTEKGKMFSEKTVRKIIQMENEILEEWTEAERRLYIELTEKFLNGLKEKTKLL